MICRLIIVMASSKPTILLHHPLNFLSSLSEPQPTSNARGCGPRDTRLTSSAAQSSLAHCGDNGGDFSMRWNAILTPDQLRAADCRCFSLFSFHHVFCFRFFSIHLLTERTIALNDCWKFGLSKTKRNVEKVELSTGGVTGN